MKKILIAIFVILGLYGSSINVIGEPVVESITTVPTNPFPLSTITVKANITGENISIVNLTVIECSETACFAYKIYQMNKTDSGDWVVNATLQDDKNRTTFVKYKFEVVSDGVLYLLEDDFWRVDLTIDSEDGDQNGGSIPGFEIITLLIAVSIGILLFKRKR